MYNNNVEGQIMKKFIITLFIFIVFISSCSNTKNMVSISQAEYEQLQMYKGFYETDQTIEYGRVTYNPKVLLEELSTYIGNDAYNDLKYSDFSVRITDEDILFYWHKDDPELAINPVHKIEFTIDKDGLKHFRYKSYHFALAKNRLSTTEATALANDFAKQFYDIDEPAMINNGHDLNSSIYDPGAVECWLQIDQDQEFIITIDLVHGIILQAERFLVNADLIEYNQG